MMEFVYVKFDETTNFKAEKDHSIVVDGAENINAINESKTIIVEDVQEPLTTQDAPTIVDEE
jgi:hypothetical protein